MPYKSQAQRKYFHYLEEKGKMPKKTVHEFDEASKGMKLPQHKAYGGMMDDDNSYKATTNSLGTEIGYPGSPKKKKMAYGGLTMDGQTEDEAWGTYEPFDSSGEPHTEHERETEHPMEYMSEGGITGFGYGNEPYKYAEGGITGFGHGNEPYKYAEGGMIETPEDYPHFESAHMMNEKPLNNGDEEEYVHKKGKYIGMMAKGGRVHGFAEALKKKMRGY